MSNDEFNGNGWNQERSGVQDEVSIHIGNILRDVPPIWPKGTIFKVPHRLREVNEKAYEPEILAIGPYHHGNDKFKIMEDHKLLYVRRLLERSKWSIDRFMPTLKDLEEQARSRYAEPMDLSQKDFLTMMFFDGCFIVEFLRISNKDVKRDEVAPIFRDNTTLNSIWRDLLLLENQLPLFVLSKLYDLTRVPDDPLELSDVIAMYFQRGGNGPLRNCSFGEVEHLLHLYHTWWTFGLPIKRQDDWILLKSSATELTESGVKFKRRDKLMEKESHLNSIKFGNGILEIPLLEVDDSTEWKLRNLIAYEQQHQREDITYFTDYMTFMDCLINSSKDVEVLRRAGIIENALGDNEAVAQMFNKMGDSVNVPSFFYNETCKSLNDYCSRKRHIWMAKLRRDYFNSPWSFLSVLAAIVLLLLTIAQTVFAVLSYTKQN